MQRTSVDGSFEEKILVPSSLQGGVPLPEEVRLCMPFVLYFSPSVPPLLG